MKTITEKELELLQRYEETSYPGLDGFYIDESDNGEFVRWDDLIQLLK